MCSIEVEIWDALLPKSVVHVTLHILNNTGLDSQTSCDTPSID